jgi:sporulation protein YlmC with PRC-barrel domain
MRTATTASLLCTMCLILGVHAQGTDTNVRPAIGSTTAGIATTATHDVVVGWSVKKGVIGRRVFNDHGDFVGKVNDVIVTRNNNTPYLIVGAGGFVGVGRHDVAVPLADIHEQGLRLVLPSASKDVIKSMPHIAYAISNSKREDYIYAVEREITRAQDKLMDLQKRATEASGDAKAQLEASRASLQKEIQNTEDKLAMLKHAAVERWREFEREVSSALNRLRRTSDASA